MQWHSFNPNLALVYKRTLCLQASLLPWIIFFDEDSDLDLPNFNILLNKFYNSNTYSLTREDGHNESRMYLNLNVEQRKFKQVQN